MKDGHLNKCKVCVRARALRRERRLREEDPEWVEAERERSRDKWRRNGHGYPKTPPHKKSANTAVNNAVRDGHLVPSETCEDCGHDFSFYRREAHHEDYDKPLEVEWLCAKCHGIRHRAVA